MVALVIAIPFLFLTTNVRIITAIMISTNAETSEAIWIVDLLLLFLHEDDVHRFVSPPPRLASMLCIKSNSKTYYIYIHLICSVLPIILAYMLLGFRLSAEGICLVSFSKDTTGIQFFSYIVNMMVVKHTLVTNVHFLTLIGGPKELNLWNCSLLCFCIINTTVSSIIALITPQNWSASSF